MILAATNNRQRGFALLIVLWTLSFLSLLGAQIVAAGRSAAQLAVNLKQAAVLEAAADGAVAQVVFMMQAARNPDFKADGMVRELYVGSTLVLVRIRNERDRVNLNTASEALLRALIMEAGGSPSIAVRLAPAILDWRTSDINSRRSGAKAADYQQAGLTYGPPGTPFKSADELLDVLGMTPALYDSLAPHITVLTDDDPDLSTIDEVVAQALADAANFAEDTADAQQVANRMLRQTRALTVASSQGNEIETTRQTLRISATAVGVGSARYVDVVVASADFQDIYPRVNILLRETNAGAGTDRRL